MKLATTDAEVGIREMAVRALVARKADVLAIAKDEKAPAERPGRGGRRREGARPQIGVLVDLLAELRPVPAARGRSQCVRDDGRVAEA